MRYNIPMKTKLSLLLLPMILAGCFNDRGPSLRYYNDCEEYYDAQGYHHQRCDPNIVNYKDIKEALKPAQNPTHGNVW
jgi:hypothetical protein